MSSKHVLVTGAAGFIGSHLVARLVAEGHRVRGVDLVHPEFAPTRAHDFRILDLRDPAAARAACDGVDEVYALAADMGGMGYISAHHAIILHGNTLIDFNTVEAARRAGVGRLLYASSACVYPEYLQGDAAVVPLREEDAYPADPQDAYGWEKLTIEKLLHHYREGPRARDPLRALPQHSWTRGHVARRAGEGAGFALVLQGRRGPPDRDPVVEICGDGEQTRSFCYIDDCVEGLLRLMASDWTTPLNLGTDRLISINGLCDLDRLARRRRRRAPPRRRTRGRPRPQQRQLAAARGARLEPSVDLEEGLYHDAWIERQRSS
ncbi:MAG: NAD-dependent epimerase/dehydratase family protein [Planctomycetota bacterium]